MLDLPATGAGSRKWALRPEVRLMKITTIHAGRIGITSSDRARRYVKAGRASWEAGGRAIRFHCEDHRNVSALLAMSSGRTVGMQAGDMPRATEKEMRGVPIMCLERMLYKIPGPRTVKPIPGVVLVRAGAPHFSA